MKRDKKTMTVILALGLSSCLVSCPAFATESAAPEGQPPAIEDQQLGGGDPSDPQTVEPEAPEAYPGQEGGSDPGPAGPGSDFGDDAVPAPEEDWDPIDEAPPRGAWGVTRKNNRFFDEILWLVENRISTGHADGMFYPKATLTREAMAAFLYRYNGRPEGTLSTTPRFSDVHRNSKFSREITWLRNTGITTGRADGTFAPKATVTREAMAAFLYRYAGKPSFVPPAASPFSDVPKNHKFYKEITWLKSTGISTGLADGTFRPGAGLTREAAAAFLYRFDKKYGTSVVID